MRRVRVVVSVSAGDVAAQGQVPGPLSNEQRSDLARVVQAAREVSGYAFAVRIGSLSAGRDSALDHHKALAVPNSSILVAVDPTARRIEIVTGSTVARVVEDRTAEFAALAMASCFVANDLVGGVREGVTLLAEHARRSSRPD